MVSPLAAVFLARGELPRRSLAAATDTRRRRQGDLKSKEYWSAEYKGVNTIAQF